MIDENEEERQYSEADLRHPKQPKWDEISKGKVEITTNKG